jgi:hypothetical protein
MKTNYILILAAIFLWCSPVSAEYCSTKADSKTTSCIYKIDRIQEGSQILISYTQQGWSMMIVVFMDEFAMIEGNATVKPGRGEEIQSIEYVTTRRDMTWQGLMMEAPLFKVSEQLLHDLGKANGKVRFWLSGSAIRKDKEVEVAAGLFSDIEAFITETRTELGDLFKDQ